MLASETRKLAREALQGKWGKAALVSLVYWLLTSVIDFVLNLIPVVGSIAQVIIELPLTFGFMVTLIKLKRGEDITYTEFLNTGFNNFASSWKVSLWIFVKMIVPIILVFVSIIVMGLGFGFSALSFSTPYILEEVDSNVNAAAGALGGASAVIGFLGLLCFIASSIWATVKSYYYKPAMFVLFDNLNMEAKAIVEESEKIMTGNRWKYFCLELSFIGWMILMPFTLGIGMLWLLPYIVVAEVIFYEYLAGKSSNVVEAKPEEIEDKVTSEE